MSALKEAIPIYKKSRSNTTRITLLNTHKENATMASWSIISLCILATILNYPVFAAPPRKLVLLPTPPLTLSYHNGPLLTGPSPLNLYFLWYGSFSPAQKQILSDFASSFSTPSPIPSPSVSSWWSNAASYTDSSHSHVSSTITFSAQASVSPSRPFLTRDAIASLLLHAIELGQLPIDDRGIYFVLTGEDVAVEGMCMSSCGFHDHVLFDNATSTERENVQEEEANANEDFHVEVKMGGGKKKASNLVFAWVGNAQRQCPGVCAWPFALPEYGPQGAAPLVPPNGDVGMDGMVINVATLLAGAATNPRGAGYFQGPATEPLEAATACTGIFGSGAYPGFPGALLMDHQTGASFNAQGINGRMFLLPSIWNPTSQTCSPPS